MEHNRVEFCGSHYHLFYVKNTKIERKNIFSCIFIEVNTSKYTAPHVTKPQKASSKRGNEPRKTSQPYSHRKSLQELIKRSQPQIEKLLHLRFTVPALTSKLLLQNPDLVPFGEEQVQSALTILLIKNPDRFVVDNQNRWMLIRRQNMAPQQSNVPLPSKKPFPTRSTIHKERPTVTDFRCSYCKDIFPTDEKRRQHEYVAHVSKIPYTPPTPTPSESARPKQNSGNESRVVEYRIVLDENYLLTAEPVYASRGQKSFKNTQNSKSGRNEDAVDGSRNYGYVAREEGRYGSYPGHDRYDDESDAE